MRPATSAGRRLATRRALAPQARALSTETSPPPSSDNNNNNSDNNNTTTTSDATASASSPAASPRVGSPPPPRQTTQTHEDFEAAVRSMNALKAYRAQRSDPNAALRRSNLPPPPPIRPPRVRSERNRAAAAAAQPWRAAVPAGPTANQTDDYESALSKALLKAKSSITLDDIEAEAVKTKKAALEFLTKRSDQVEEKDDFAYPHYRAMLELAQDPTKVINNDLMRRALDARKKIQFEERPQYNFYRTEYDPEAEVMTAVRAVMSRPTLEPTPWSQDPEHDVLWKHETRETPAGLIETGKEIHFMNGYFLSRFIKPGGRIMTRRESGLSAKNQRKLAKAIKAAKQLGTLPVMEKYFATFDDNIKGQEYLNPLAGPKVKVSRTGLAASLKGIESRVFGVKEDFEGDEEEEDEEMEFLEDDDDVEDEDPRYPTAAFRHGPPGPLEGVFGPPPKGGSGASAAGEEASGKHA